MDSNTAALVIAIRNALAIFDAKQVLGNRHMTTDHEAWHVAFDLNTHGGTFTTLEPNPDCPYCNEGWTNDA